MVKKLLEHFMKENCKRLIKKNSEQKMYLRKKVVSYMSDGKVMIIHLIVGLRKKIQCNYKKMGQYFLKKYNPFSGDINVKVDLSNYATKTVIKNISHVNTSSFALKTDVTNLKTEVDKLDIDKLAPVHSDLSQLSDVVKNDVVKKTGYNKLVTKVDKIDTSGLVKKTDYNTKITEIEGEIPDTSGLVKKTNYNTKITEIKGKIPDTSGLVKKTDYNIKITEIEYKIPDTSNLTTKTTLTTVENKIPDTGNLATKTALTTAENKNS